jgi:crotonobetainyl-CoA:carnitine CoA-transferase CaiB-like acyl-CoA transferase
MIVYAIVLLLQVRERTRTGQEVNASSLDICMSMQAMQIGDYLIGGNRLAKRERGKDDRLMGRHDAADGGQMAWGSMSQLRMVE